MTTKKESGHGKNVANFEDLISYVTGYGGSYNPSSAAITIGQLNTLYTNADQIVNNARNAKAAIADAERNRRAEFKRLNGLSLKLVAALTACGASKDVLKQAIALRNKITGRQKLTKADAGKKIVKQGEKQNENDLQNQKEKQGDIKRKHSTMQTSFDSKMEHLANFITLLNTVGTYNPNESELQIANLNMFLGVLKNTNTSVINLTTNASNALIARDEILYKTQSGLVDIAMAVKSYVKSVFGARSPQYKQVSKLQFKRY